MEQLLNKAKELNAALQQELADAKLATAAANNTAAANRVFKAELTEQKADIEAREAAIKDIENAQGILAQVAKERTALSEAGVVFEQQKADFGKKVAAHNEKALVLKRDQDLMVNDRALLRKQQDELKEKAANYKDEILAKLKAVK